MGGLVIDKNILSKISEAARLRLSEEELVAFENQFSSILEYFSIVNEIDAGEDELNYVTSNKNVLRIDAKPLNFSGRENILRQVPRRNNDMIVVPKSL